MNTHNEKQDVKLDERWGQPHPVHDPYILAHFRARPSDVLITTAPKAGTTWMQQILHQLRTGGDTSFQNIDDVVPWLEKPREGFTWQQRLDEFDKLDAPRIFKTHCTFEQTPGFGTAKIVMTSRDPRDCCVSFYHHTMNLTDEALIHLGATRPHSFDEFFENWMAFGAWYRNVKSWWPYRSHERVLWLRYEDLLSDFDAQLSRIIGFLGWELTDEQLKKVKEYSSFAWMKAHTERFETPLREGETCFKPMQFIRQGKVGDHKTLLSKEQEIRILIRARHELDRDCLVFLNLSE